MTVLQCYARELLRQLESSYPCRAGYRYAATAGRSIRIVVTRDGSPRPIAVFQSAPLHATDSLSARAIALELAMQGDYCSIDKPARSPA